MYPSNLSRKPPWPGIKFPLSLIPILLLKKDSKRSPKKEKSPIVKPNIKAYRKFMSIRSLIKTDAKIEKNKPIKVPSIVLPLLIVGAIFYTPKTFPPI